MRLHVSAYYPSLAAHGKSATSGVSQPKRLTDELFGEDPILLSQIVNQIRLVVVQPSSQREDEELQSMGLRPSLRRSDKARTGRQPRARPHNPTKEQHRSRSWPIDEHGV